MARLAKVMPAQQHTPIKMGLPPVLTSLTRSVLRPIAAMARMMKYLERALKGWNRAGSAPATVEAVVMMEARTKNRMKKGKIFFRSKEPLETLPPRLTCQVRQKARARVMGMMARVRVSLTMVAYSSTAPLVPWRVSQVAAAAPVSLRVGASKTIGEFVIAPKVERFFLDHPEASFSLMVDNTQVLLRALEAGRLDFVLVEGFFERSRYESRLYRQEAFFGVCPPGHRLAGRAVAMEELAGERILVRETGSGTRAIFEEALRRQNRTLRSFPSVATISDFSTIKSLVADGLGVSFLYAPVVERELAQGTLARFDLAGTPMSGAFYFVCLKDNLFAQSWADWMA